MCSMPTYTVVTSKALVLVCVKVKHKMLSKADKFSFDMSAEELMRCFTEFHEFQEVCLSFTAARRLTIMKLMKSDIKVQ